MAYVIAFQQARTGIQICTIRSRVGVSQKALDVMMFCKVFCGDGFTILQALPVGLLPDRRRLKFCRDIGAAQHLCGKHDVVIQPIGQDQLFLSAGGERSDVLLVRKSKGIAACLRKISRPKWLMKMNPKPKRAIFEFRVA